MFIKILLLLPVLRYAAVQISRDYTVIPYSNLNAAGDWVDDFVSVTFSVHGESTAARARSVFEDAFVDFGIITATTCQYVYNVTLCVTL